MVWPADASCAVCYVPGTCKLTCDLTKKCTTGIALGSPATGVDRGVNQTESRLLVPALCSKSVLSATWKPLQNLRLPGALGHPQHQFEPLHLLSCGCSQIQYAPLLSDA